MRCSWLLAALVFQTEKNPMLRIVKKRDFSVINEVRAAREKHAARFDYDLEKIFEDIRARQKASGRKYVRYPAKRIVSEEFAPVGDE